MSAGGDVPRPVVILIGGATGTGKSTVATELAHRLGITRVTSTDFIRQTIRAFFPPELMPVVHYSSFEGDETIECFLDQTRTVLIGIEAVSDAERRGTPRGLFGIWFSWNVSILGVSYGIYVFSLGLSVWQAIVGILRL